MLEVSAEDTSHGDVVTQTVNTGAYTGDATNDQLSRNTCATRSIERVDHHRIGDRIALHRNCTLRTKLHFSFNEVDELRSQTLRSDQQRLVVAISAEPGEMVEELYDVVADGVIACDVSNVFVVPG